MAGEGFGRLGSSESELSATPLLLLRCDRTGLEDVDGAEFLRCLNGVVGGRRARERDERRVNFEANATSVVDTLGRGVEGRPLLGGEIKYSIKGMQI